MLLLGDHLVSNIPSLFSLHLLLVCLAQELKGSRVTEEHDDSVSMNH
jgi:hypothetical protein